MYLILPQDKALSWPYAKSIFYGLSCFDISKKGKTTEHNLKFAATCTLFLKALQYFCDVSR